MTMRARLGGVEIIRIEVTDRVHGATFHYSYTVEARLGCAVQATDENTDRRWSGPHAVSLCNVAPLLSYMGES